MHIHIIIFDVSWLFALMYLSFAPYTEKEEKGKLFMLYFANNKEFPLTLGFNS